MQCALKITFFFFLNILIPQCFQKGNHLFLSIETHHQLLFSAAGENTELALALL